MYHYFGGIYCLNLQGRRVSQLGKSMIVNEPLGTNGFLYHEPSSFILLHFFPCLTYSILLQVPFHLTLLAFSGSLVPTGWLTASVPVLPFLYHKTIFLLGLLFYPEEWGSIFLQLNNGFSHLPWWEPHILQRMMLIWFLLE